MQQKVSLSKYHQNPAAVQEISKIYQKTKTEKVSEQDLNAIKNNLTVLQIFKTDSVNQVQYIRGEIENEKHLSELIHLVQLSAIMVRNFANKKEWHKVILELNPWSQYSANLVYEESSLVGLRVASLIRSLLFDEIDLIRTQFKSEISKNKDLKAWLSNLRLPWPVDRVVLFESKRFLKLKSMQVAEKLAIKLQQNPYKTAAELLSKEKQNIPDKDYDFLTQMWSTKDIEIMKDEMNRMGEMLLKLATEEYFAQKGLYPKNAEDLKLGGYLERLPVDYKSGKTMTIPL